MENAENTFYLQKDNLLSTHTEETKTLFEVRLVEVKFVNLLEKHATVSDVTLLSGTRAIEKRVREFKITIEHSGTRQERSDGDNQTKGRYSLATQK